MADCKAKAEIQKLLEDLSAEEEGAQPGVLMKRLKNALNLPERSGLDEKGINELENRLRKDVKSLVVSTSDYSPAELVSKASAEVILKGVLLDKGKNQVSLKHNVLNPPSSVKLINVTLSPSEESFMFSSERQHDSFQKDLNSIGYTIAADLASKGEVEVKCSQNRTLEKTSEMLDQVNFESVCHKETIPLAACHLSDRDVKLSPDVIEELKDIEKMMKVSDCKEKCQHFFDKYGSHVKLGTIHFGGSICFVAKYQSHQKSNRQHLQTLLKHAVKAYASASLKMGGFSIGGSVSAEQLKFSSDENQQFEKTELSIITCETIVNGGPIGIGYIPLWKSGLRAYNSTWAVIDNGTVDDFVGIWDLVKNHSCNFREPEQLALLLRKFWKQLYSGTCDTLSQDKLFAMDLLYQLEPKLAKWNSSSNTEGKGTEHLEQIVQLVRELEKSVNTSQCWVDFLCKSAEMNSFFSNIVKQANTYSSGDIMKIQKMLIELVHPMQDVHFPSKNDVIPWIRESDDQHQYPDKQFIVNDIKELSQELKQIISKIEIEKMNNQEQTWNKMMLTDLLSCLESFLSLCRDKYQVFLTNILLQTLGYNKDHKTFNMDITLDTVTKFRQDLLKTWSDYCSHKKRGKDQSDAFLLYVLLTLEDTCPRKAKEKRFTTLLPEMQSELSKNLADVVSRFISSSPFQLLEMKQAMLDISQGNMCFMAEANDDDMGKLENPGKAVQDIPFSSAAENFENAAETYRTILEKLNLTDYYPGKITLMDARKLRKTSEERLSDVPWILIKKLFSGDLHARDSTMSQVLVSVSSEDDELDNFLSEIDRTDTNGMLSTLDVLVVLFGCCDSFLQQALAQKLFECKLAIPLMYPLGTPNKMMLSLWSLRTIDIDGALVTETPMPIVAFLKLGQLSHFSKSKLMNDILSDNNHHTFVNYHCPNGIEQRVLSDGLVECSWYVKATKEDSVDSDILPSSMMLLNLRGDASKLHRQRELLCNISSIIVVLATASELERHVESYNEMAKSAQIVIPLILFEGDTLPKMQEEKKKLQCLGKSHQAVINKMKDGKTKGDNLLKADICKALAKHLTDFPGKMLKNCFDQQPSNFLSIDEHMDDCEDGKRNATKAVDPLFKVAVSDRKKVCLPLQEDEWKQFCKLKKDRHRVCSETEEFTIQQQINKIDLEMCQQREGQLNLCKHMSDMAVQFTASLMTGGQQKVLYFLNWMKIILDKESRAQTSDLRRKYGAKWNELQTAKENKNESEISKLATEVAKLENELATASIGLEHMFRELGQIYEALHEGSREIESLTTLRNNMHKLPYVAADLLLKGYPLELLDGDASGIPITWMKAVFHQLEVLIGDKNLFVLSVLGIQSSGKSTLLNTMFGLQFAVSAGRCTRGAYMQLIPVDESSGLPFNYVLVIDTEGLRAPQLASSKHVHDNELATFAVGLADVTVVNIKGENVSEIQDVLQIVVHAFIRMKAVNSNRDYKRTCVFIHQNVSDINAKEMMMHERHKIVEKLDEITREAALSENVGDVTNFQQIINFDQQTHVWYFPDLWLGNPPMAPVNPKYSQKVGEVKDYLLNEIAKNQMMFVIPSDLFIRINDIWKGILSEDFVFNFRNSLEVRAYAKLDSMYNSLIWELQKLVITFRQEKATKYLTECRETSSLDDVANELISELTKEISEKVENLKKDLEKYFSESKYNEIIIQWKATKMLGLANEGERLIEASRTYVNSMKKECKMKIIQSEEEESHLDEIINKANQVADEMKDRELQEDTIRKEFNNIWVTFIQKHAVETKDNTVHVDSIVENVLMDVFKAHRELLRKELEENLLTLPLTQALIISITVNDVKKEHLNENKSFIRKFADAVRRKDRLPEAMTYLYEGTSHVLEKVEQSLKNMCNPQEQVQELTIRKLFKELQQEMDDLQKQMDSRGFLIVPAYTIKVTVLVGRQTVKQFLEAQKEYVASHSAQAYLEKYHNMVWDLFQNKVKESTAEITVKDMFCHLIEELLFEKMQERAALVLTNKVMNDFSYGKFHLIMNILKDLANKGCFENYVEYIHNSKIFATRFILQHFEENVFAGEHSEYAKVATGELTHLLEKLLKCISEANEQMNEKKEKSLVQWIHLIRGKSELPMPENKFEPICRQHIVNDYNHLKNIIEKELNSWSKNVDWKASVTKSWKDHLVENVMQNLWGCPAQCPFCKEPCSITDPNHMKERSHSCIQHKPQGVSGGHWYQSDKLRTDTCGFSVHAKYLFLCGYVCHNCTSGKEWHEYEEYKKYVPEWDIPPDPTNASSKYWMWFMAKYKEDLVRYYKKKLPDIPVAWENITKEEALNDLAY